MSPPQGSLPWPPLYVCSVAQSCLTLCDPMDSIVCQAPLFMGFSRQEYWSGWPCLLPWDLPNPGIELTSLMSAALVGRFFTRIMTVYFWISVLTILNLFFSPLHPYSHPHLHPYMEASRILYRGQYEEIQAESISQYFKNVIYTTHHYTSPSKMIQWKDDFDESFCFTHCISITFCLSSHRTNFTIFRTRFFFVRLS